ncbi:DUF6022 family protein [Paenibacillus sp. P96]|uniref:DUF6022 family protein n=1 Tax=Paenibacillus zeirhizosphaerae TaxID=2987519 RepID=A0ABT9FU13_9BACL|nr:DUF6022 family protein [Paenibacillus sp. P96]MDP4098154.1 DUF6022 family protein [Paenibacillus sp. P96]
MKKQLPVMESGMSMETIGEAGNRYIAAVWEELYKERYEQLAQAFLEIEDAAYGLYLDQLMPPLFDRLEEAGFRALGPVKEDNFIIGKCLKFSDSLEKWGTEDHRIRLFWNVIRNERHEPLGTLITSIPHSHLKFEIPRAPQLYVLAQTEREQIVKGMREIMSESGEA